MTTRSPIILPRLDPATSGAASLFSFDQRSLRLLGEYVPGGDAIIIDPGLSLARRPEAIRSHEEAHQLLTMNTTFGCFTSLLRLLAERGLPQRPLIAAMNAQWSVQELCATYAEVTAVAISWPEDIPSYVESLPSAKENNPPYREAFDMIAQHLPVDRAAPLERIAAQNQLVQLICGSALMTDCLLKALKCNISEESLCSCIDDSPHDRLEKIVSVLSALGALDEITNLIADSVRRKDVDRLKTVNLDIIQEFGRLIPDVVIQDEGQMQRQCGAVMKAWSADPELIKGGLSEYFARPLKVAKKRPLPRILYPDSESSRLLAENRPKRISQKELSQYLLLCVTRNLGVELRVSIRRDLVEIGLFGLSPYFLDRPDAPWPGPGPIDGEPPLPSDLEGVTTTHAVLEALREFPQLPHVLSFVEGSWLRWDSMCEGMEQFLNRIRICWYQHEVSVQTVQELLQFDNLMNGARYSIFKYGEHLYGSYIFDPENPDTLGYVRLAGDVSVRLLDQICDELGIPWTHPDSIFQGRRQLMTMLATTR